MVAARLEPQGQRIGKHQHVHDILVDPSFKNLLLGLGSAARQTYCI